MRDATHGTGRPEPASLTLQASWLLVAKVIGFLASLAIPLVLVRTLDKAQFGLYKQVFLLVGTAQAILPLGFAYSAFYFLPREHQRRAQVVSHIAFFNLGVGVLALVALSAFPGILGLVFSAPHLQPDATLIGLLILVTISGSFLEIVGAANQEAVWSGLFIVAAQFSKTLFMLSAALLAPSIRALIIASILQGALQSAILVWYLQSRFPGVSRGIDRDLLRTQLSYSLPFALYGLAFTLGSDLPNYLIASRFGPAQYAVYAIGCLQLPILALLNDSAAAVLTPRLSSLQQGGEKRRLLLFSIRATTKLALLCFPIFCFLLAFGRDFLVLLYTRQYMESWPLMVVNLALIPSSVVPFDPIFRSHSEHRFTPLRVQALTTTALIVTMWLTLPRIGLLASVSLLVSCRVLERAILTVHAAKILGFQATDFRLLKDLGVIACGAAVSSLAALAFRQALGGSPLPVILVFCGAMFAIVYVLTMLCCRVVTRAELESIQQRLGRGIAWVSTGAPAADSCTKELSSRSLDRGRSPHSP